MSKCETNAHAHTYTHSQTQMRPIENSVKDLIFTIYWSSHKAIFLRYANLQAQITFPLPARLQHQFLTHSLNKCSQPNLTYWPELIPWINSHNTFRKWPKVTWDKHNIKRVNPKTILKLCTSPVVSLSYSCTSFTWWELVPHSSFHSERHIWDYIRIASQIWVDRSCKHLHCWTDGDGKSFIPMEGDWLEPLDSFCSIGQPTIDTSFFQSLCQNKDCLNNLIYAHGCT